MSRLIILEGNRGVGKSTVASNIRQTVSEVTLINPTGFHLDGEQGLEKIVEYYDNWFAFFKMMKKVNATFVLDRFFFTEMVFSTLYKNYDFETDYRRYLSQLGEIANRIDFMLLFSNDASVIEQRLNRDKVAFSNVNDDSEQSLKQFEVYARIYGDMIDKPIDNIFVHTLNTSKMNQDEVAKVVKQRLGLKSK